MATRFSAFRRLLLASWVAACTTPVSWAQVRAADTLAPWQAGGLDIHHIATGQGNATLVILPDGTSLLIDAGATASAAEVTTAPMPSAQRRAGEWIGRYVQRQLAAAGLSTLDYLLVTHLHPDHTGAVRETSPASTNGDYRLTGVTDVAEMVPIGTVVDRGYPAYDYPVTENASFARNYKAYVQSRVQRGEAVERFVVGSDSQFRPKAYRAVNGVFGVRNIAANGVVWSGVGGQTRSLFPPLETLAPRNYPTENMCSTAIRIHSGKFAYFTAGDLTSDTLFGELPWRDVLTAAARAAGPADVATADHHGLFDSLNADVTRLLQAQAWVIQAWHVSHPSIQQLDMMLSDRLYSGPRDVFATNMTKENLLINHRLLQKLRSMAGHVVVRVAPGGETFKIIVTDEQDERDTEKLKLGPYESRAGIASVRSGEMARP